METDRALASLRDVLASGSGPLRMLGHGLFVAALALGIPVLDAAGVTEGFGLSLGFVGRAVWFSSVALAILVGARAVYSKREELDTLKERARNVAMMPDSARERIYEARSRAGEIAGLADRGLRGNQVRIDDVLRKSEELQALAAAVAPPHYAVAEAANAFCKWMSVLALNSGEPAPDWSSSPIESSALQDAERQARAKGRLALTALDSACQEALEKYPPVSLLKD